MADTRLYESYQSCNVTQFKTTIEVNLGPQGHLRERLVFALGLNKWPTVHHVEETIGFEAVCPRPTALQRAALGDRQFVLFGEGESRCKSYSLKIASEVLPFRIGDRTPPKLLAFISFNLFHEGDRAIIKTRSEVAFGRKSRKTLEWTCRTLIFGMDHKALMDTCPYFEFLAPDYDSDHDWSQDEGLKDYHLARSQPFFLPISFHTQFWTQRRYPISTLPSEIVQTISSFLPLPSVQSLSQAIPAFRDVLSTEATRRMNELLSPYFQSNIKGFVDLIIKTRSLIAASAVLYAFQGKMESWTPGDLDLVVPGGSSVNVVVLYLMDHSTAPMAFLTGTTLGHLFPDLTLAHKSRRSIYGRAKRPNDGEVARAKYTGRGYELVEGLAVPDDADPKNVLGSVEGRIWKTAVDFK
ncbi:hypothetical protein RQP46_010694 [Phenoliferia psychrophenolica]